MSQTKTRPRRVREKLPPAEQAQEAHVVTELTSKALKVHLLWAYAVVILGVLIASAGSMVTASMSQDFDAAQLVLIVGLGIGVLGVIYAAVT